MGNCLDVCLVSVHCSSQNWVDLQHISVMAAIGMFYYRLSNVRESDWF